MIANFMSTFPYLRLLSAAPLLRRDQTTYYALLFASSFDRRLLHRNCIGKTDEN
jgi:hypothetical protein